MDNKKLFTLAHKQARQTVDKVGDYQIAFTLALQELRQSESKLKTALNFLKEEWRLVIGTALEVFLMNAFMFCMTFLCFVLGLTPLVILFTCVSLFITYAQISTAKCCYKAQQTRARNSRPPKACYKMLAM